MRTSRKRRRRTTSRPHRKRTKAPGRSPGPPRPTTIRLHSPSSRCRSIRSGWSASTSRRLPGPSSSKNWPASPAPRSTGRSCLATPSTCVEQEVHGRRSPRHHQRAPAGPRIRHSLRGQDEQHEGRPSRRLEYSPGSPRGPRRSRQPPAARPGESLFRLDWLLAKDAVEEFKQVLSPKAKLLALKTTNRLEAIDSAVNLRQLASLLDEEQGRNSLDRLAQEFELRYTRAPEVVEQLELFLGLKKPGQNGTEAPIRCSRCSCSGWP